MSKQSPERGHNECVLRIKFDHWDSALAAGWEHPYRQIAVDAASTALEKTQTAITAIGSLAMRIVRS